MNIKEELYNQCFQFIENRLITIQKTMTEIQESLLSETKSSAGDKHETGRAMLQLEREKAGNQLSEILKIKALLSKIDTEKTSKKISLGSVIYTSKANYFIAISVGELAVKNQKFYAVSGNTPMAKLLLGKAIGDKIKFRDQTFSITNLI